RRIDNPRSCRSGFILEALYIYIYIYLKFTLAPINTFSLDEGIHQDSTIKEYEEKKDGKKVIEEIKTHSGCYCSAYSTLFFRGGYRSQIEKFSRTSIHELLVESPKLDSPK
ncbi:hypothetical protein L9F63_012320, partial [Diploptera punctata]